MQTAHTQDGQIEILAKLVELMDNGATDTSSEVAALYAEFHRLDEDTAENIDPRIITRWALDNYDPMHLREMNRERTLSECIKALERAAVQFDFTAAALAKGQTVSIGSLQNCAAACNVAVAKAKLGFVGLETLETKLTRLADGYERTADAEENESEAESLRLKCQNIRDALKAVKI